jgi:hypothetical protein
VTLLIPRRPKARLQLGEKNDLHGADIDELRNEARAVIRLCNRLIRTKEMLLRSQQDVKDTGSLQFLMNDIDYLEGLVEKNERFLARTGTPSRISFYLGGC